MILPLGDHPNPPGTPWVTRALLGLNVAVFLLVTLPLSGRAADPTDPLLPEYLRMLAELLPGVSPRELARSVSAYDLVTFQWGFRPVEASATTLITSMFLHGGFLHLAGNMLFLWIYGDNVEQRLGPVRYLLAYLATGAAATLFHAGFDPDSVRPLVGASGAISGVLGFYFLWFPRNEVRLLVAFFPWIVDTFMVPARLVLGAYLVLDNLLPFVLARGAGGVAHGAHIGGFLAGLAAAAVLVRLDLLRPEEIRVPGANFAGRPSGRRDSFTAGERGRRQGPRQDPTRLARQLQEARAAGDRERVARRWLALGRDAPDALPCHEALDVAGQLAVAGRAELAAELATGVLAFERQGPLAARAHLFLADVLLTVIGRPEDAGRHFAAAMAADSSDHVAERARQGLSRTAAARHRIAQPRRPERW